MPRAKVGATKVDIPVEAAEGRPKRATASKDINYSDAPPKKERAATKKPDETGDVANVPAKKRKAEAKSKPAAKGKDKKLVEDEEEVKEDAPKPKGKSVKKPEVAKDTVEPPKEEVKPKARGKKADSKIDNGNDEEKPVKNGRKKKGQSEESSKE